MQKALRPGDAAFAHVEKVVSRAEGQLAGWLGLAGPEGQCSRPQSPLPCISTGHKGKLEVMRHTSTHKHLALSRVLAL